MSHGDFLQKIRDSTSNMVDFDKLKEELKK